MFGALVLEFSGTITLMGFGLRVKIKVFNVRV
jgi:hypothetical protein